MLPDCRIHSLLGSPISIGGTNPMAYSCDLRSNSVTRKFNQMIKSIVSLAFATVLLGPMAFAQTTSTSATMGAGGVTAATTITTAAESDGVVTEFTPRSHLSLKTDAVEPVQYKFGRSVIYATTGGRVIAASRIKKDSKVRVHYIKQGDDMLVDRVILQDVD